VRFRLPFLGSLAVIGRFEDRLFALRDANGCTVREAIQQLGLDPSRIQEARADQQAFAYFEFHIEQGPVLERLDVPLGVINVIAGQSRAVATFRGKANHAGTTPMALRQDALGAAAEWITFVEREAVRTEGLVATVGQMDVQRGVRLVPRVDRWLRFARGAAAAHCRSEG